MNNKYLFPLLFFLLTIVGLFSGKAQVANSNNYLNNRYPLLQKPYIELPLGSIQAKGWLLEMLERQKSGATGRMDEKNFFYCSEIGWNFKNKNHEIV